MKDVSISNDIGTLSLGSYTSAQILFDQDITERANTQWYSTPNTNFVTITYNLDNDPSVIYISRTYIFDDTTAPVTDTFVKEVIKKYGAPSSVVNHWVTDYVWADGTTATGAAPNNCGVELLQMFGQNPFSEMLPVRRHHVVIS